MTIIAPNYYPQFSCLMGKCIHTCCAGWEIDIDPVSMNRYKQLNGPFAKHLMEQIVFDGQQAFFRLDQNERCPFLNQDGLCDMILKLGEDALCQICADHPRFRNHFSNCVEVGLGLCCEAAGKLILTYKQPVQLMVLAQNEEEQAAEDEESAFFDARNELFAIVQDRKLTITQRIANLFTAAGTSVEKWKMSEWNAFLFELERLDETWTVRLNAAELYEPLYEEILCSEEWENAFEQLVVYLLFRHLAGALDDGSWQARIIYAGLVWRLLRMMLAVHAARSKQFCMDDLIEIAREYSSEIEYSDVNLDAALDWIEDKMQQQQSYE